MEIETLHVGFKSPDVNVDCNSLGVSIKKTLGDVNNEVVKTFDVRRRVTRFKTVITYSLAITNTPCNTQCRV